MYHISPNRSTVRENKAFGAHLKFSVIKPVVWYMYNSGILLEPHGPLFTRKWKLIAHMRQPNGLEYCLNFTAS